MQIEDCAGLDLDGRTGLKWFEVDKGELLEELVSMEVVEKENSHTYYLYIYKTLSN